MIGEVIHSRVDNKLYQEDVELVNNSVCIGVEIELENIRYFSHTSRFTNIFTFWTAIEDGSIRNGTEFIFSEPFKGKNITTALSLMNDFLAEYKEDYGGVDTTERCSVHIHLDIRELDAISLNNLILVYMLFERIIFWHIAPNRVKNNYCRPLTDSSFKDILKQLLALRSIGFSRDCDTINIIRDRCDKYSALNVLPAHSYGSVEFRHHPGTTDMNKVLKWINIILALYNISKENTVNELISKIEQSSVKDVFISVFKNTTLGDEELLSDSVVDMLYHKGRNDIIDILSGDTLPNVCTRELFDTLRTGSRKLDLVTKFKQRYLENI